MTATLVDIHDINDILSGPTVFAIDAYITTALTHMIMPGVRAFIRAVAQEDDDGADEYICQVQEDICTLVWQAVEIIGTPRASRCVKMIAFAGNAAIVERMRKLAQDMAAGGDGHIGMHRIEKSVRVVVFMCSETAAQEVAESPEKEMEVAIRQNV
jgi:hypothetical protein